jgi:N-acetylglucosaminyldiphosphoundecaprenol N-acetyl-beta-D-mannosaminyltransferase
MSTHSTSVTPSNAGLPAHPAVFRFGGLELTPLRRQAAADWVIQRAQRDAAAVVVTSHIYHVLMARRHPDFRHAVGAADLNVADGWPLVAASRLLRPALPGRVPGIDLVSEVLAGSVRMRVAILGGPGDSAAHLGDRLLVSHQLVLTDPLPAGEWSNEDAIQDLERRLERGRPNLILIGLGAPHQELLATRLRAVASGPIIACGAAIEVLAGDRRRAPRLMRAAGMEWAFRMALEPRRLGMRYARSSVLFGLVALQEGIDRIRGPLDGL